MACYFEEGSAPMLALEKMVDDVGMANVLWALSHIAGAKAQHLAENWQDTTSAKFWDLRSRKLDKVAALPVMHDA